MGALSGVRAVLSGLGKGLGIAQAFIHFWHSDTSCSGYFRTQAAVALRSLRVPRPLRGLLLYLRDRSATPSFVRPRVGARTGEFISGIADIARQHLSATTRALCAVCRSVLGHRAPTVLVAEDSGVDGSGR